MAYQVSKVEVWTAEIEDRAGGLAAKLKPLAAVRANLAFLIARRQPHRRGKGVIFLGPLSGNRQTSAARAAGLTKADDMVALRVEGANKAGAVHHISRLLADAGINLRGVSASVIGNRFVAFVGFDKAVDAGKAARLLRG